MAFSVPGLLNIEAPVKLKIFVVVVVHESTGGFVMATVDHAGGCFFFVKGLFIDWAFLRVRSIASHHLLRVLNRNFLP